MHGTHIKIFLQLLICHIARKGCRQRLGDIVIDLCMVVSVDGREKQNQKNDQPQFIMLCNEPGRFLHISYERSVSCLLNGLVKDKDHGRKQGDTAYHTDHNTLCHDNAQVPAQGKGHAAKSCKSGNGGN